jgi:hypothetical protein
MHSRRSKTIALALTLAFSACEADPDTTTDAGAGAAGGGPSGGTGGAGGEAPGGGLTGGTGGAGGSGPVDCDPVDVACPTMRPLYGTPCAEGLSCVYEPTRADPARFTLTCPDGRWAEMMDCSNAGEGGVCGLPVFGEACDAPATSGLPPGHLELGPEFVDAPFRAFDAAEQVVEVTGGQGSPMLPFRVRYVPDDPAVTPPTCVEIGIQLSVAGEAPPPPATQTLRLRCGTSLRAYVIDALPLADDRLTTLDLTVGVTGGPSTTSLVQVQGMPQFGAPQR